MGENANNQATENANTYVNANVNQGQQNEPQNNPAANNTEPTNQGNQQEPPKTFTQEELNAIAANEKRQGKQAVMKLFGIADEKDLKAAAEKFNAWADSQKTAEAKLKEQEDKVAQAEAKVAEAEAKVACLGAGVGTESVDDVLAIAKTKVTDDKGLSVVLEEMKKDPKYAGFFGAQSNGGTGSPGGHSNGSGSGNTALENIGERLGKQRAQSPTKSNFFRN